MRNGSMIVRKDMRRSGLRKTPSRRDAAWM
jgi:hypothetical protein